MVDFGAKHSHGSYKRQDGCDDINAQSDGKDGNRHRDRGQRNEQSHDKRNGADNHQNVADLS